MTKLPKYPIAAADLDAPKVKRAAQELPNGYVRAESSAEAYYRAYPQFRPRRLSARRERRRAIRGS
jgi:hypothetical protein